MVETDHLLEATMIMRLLPGPDRGHTVGISHLLQSLGDMSHIQVGLNVEIVFHVLNLHLHCQIWMMLHPLAKLLRWMPPQRALHRHRKDLEISLET